MISPSAPRGPGKSLPRSDATYDASTMIWLSLSRCFLAGIEPFDAYIIKSAGIATISVAVVGLAISLFFPMAYCKFGCPTGWLLELIRRRSGKDKYSERDWAGLVLLELADGLYVVPLCVWLG